MMQMVIYFQIEKNNREKGKLLPVFFFFLLPSLCYLLVRILSQIIGKKCARIRMDS